MGPVLPPGATLTGVVAAFDDGTGLGVVRAEDGTEYDLHCTAIADGSRTVAVGAEVRFAVVAGRRGRWEASYLVPA